jgi:hypothetical protein
LVFRKILRRLLGDLVGTVAEVVVSTCNAILHSKCTHNTILLHNKVAIQHSFTYYSHNNQKDLKLNLDRILGGQLIRIGYLLKITTEPIELAKEGTIYIVLGNLLISVWKRKR